jgi:hypothetical protein
MATPSDGSLHASWCLRGTTNSCPLARWLWRWRWRFLVLALAHGNDRHYRGGRRRRRRRRGGRRRRSISSILCFPSIFSRRSFGNDGGSASDVLLPLLNHVPSLRKRGLLQSLRHGTASDEGALELV